MAPFPGSAAYIGLCIEFQSAAPLQVRNEFFVILKRLVFAITNLGKLFYQSPVNRGYGIFFSKYDI